MTPEEISKELIHLHDNYGMTYSFVAKKIKISRPYVKDTKKRELGGSGILK